MQSQAMRGQDTSKAISSLVGAGKQYLDINNERRQKILDNTVFDYDLTANAVVNDNYQQMFNDMIRQPMIDFLSSKGKIGYISPQDINELQLLQKQFERELGLAKNVVNSWNQAKVLAQDPKNFGIYELDEEKWNGFMDIMTGKYKENPSAYMRSIYSTGEVNESPFLKIKAADINSVTNIILNDAIKQLPTDEEILKREYETKGKTITTINQQQVVGQAKKEMLGDVMFNLLKTGKYGDLRNIAKGAQTYIDWALPQKIDPISAIAFSIDKKVNDYYGGMEKAIVKEKKITEIEPTKKTGGSGGNYTRVKKIGVKWDFGSTPIPYSKDITYIDKKGKTKSETYKNASVVAIDEQNKTATVVVPKAKDEDINEILKEARENEGLKSTDTSMDAQLMEALFATERFKSIKVPLSTSLLNEILSGAEKKKIYIEGLENLKLEEEKEKINW